MTRQKPSHLLPITRRVIELVLLGLGLVSMIPAALFFGLADLIHDNAGEGDRWE